MPSDKDKIIALSGYGKKIIAGTVSLADTGTFTVDMATIESIIIMSTVSGHIATGSVSGSTVTVGLINHDGTAVGSAESLYYIAFGK